MDGTALTTAIGGLTFAKNVLMTIINGKIELDTRERILEVVTRLGDTQDTMFGLRDENLTLLEENDRLKKDAARNETWGKRLADYELTTTEGSATVYASKNSPPHYACPSCVNDERIEVLQDKRGPSGLWHCPGCSKQFAISVKRADPPIPYPPSGWQAR